MADTPSGSLMPPRRQSMRIAQAKSISPLPSLSSSLGSTPEPSRLPTPVEHTSTAPISANSKGKAKADATAANDDSVPQRRSTRARRPPQRFVCDVGEVSDSEPCSSAQIPRKRGRPEAREVAPQEIVPKQIVIENKVLEAVMRDHKPKPRKGVHARLDTFKTHKGAYIKRMTAANKRKIKGFIRKASAAAAAKTEEAAKATTAADAVAAINAANAWAREKAKLQAVLEQYRVKQKAADEGKAAVRAWPPKPDPLYGWCQLPPYPTPPPEPHWQLKKVVLSGPNQTPKELRPIKSDKGPWYKVGDDVNGYSTIYAKSQLGALAAQKYQITPDMIHDVHFNNHRRHPTDAELLKEVQRTASFPYQNLATPTRLKMGPVPVTANGPDTVSGAGKSDDKMDVDGSDDDMDVDESDENTPAQPHDPLHILATAAQEVERRVENPTNDPLVTLSIAAREVERNAEVRELEFLHDAYQLLSEPPIRPTIHRPDRGRYWKTIAERSTADKETGQ